MAESDGGAQQAPATVVALEVDGRQYRLSLPDAATDYIQKKVATERVPYEHEMLADMKRRLRPGDLVVDAGANVGNHTLYLAAVAGCRVEAYEASATLCSAIRDSVALNRLSEQVHVHAVALGAGSARARFEALRPDNLGAQSLGLGEGDIDVVALDAQALPGTVHALKIDVEGMELAVLEGAQALIARDRPLLYVECISEKAFRGIAGWLGERGYVHWDTFNATPTHLFVPGETVSLEQRLARLQFKAVQDDYRQALLAGNVRQKLTRAYDNEREAKAQNAALTAELAARNAELAELRGHHEALRTELADVSGRRDRERRAASTQAGIDAARIQSLQTELARVGTQVSEREAEMARLHLRLEELQTLAERREQELQTLAARRELELEQLRRQHDDELAQLRSQRDAELARLNAQLADLERQNGERQSLIAALQAESDRSRAEAGRLQERVAQLELQHAELVEERQRQQRALEMKTGRAEALSARVELLEERLARTKASGSYLIGAALAKSTRSPGAALRLPLRLWEIFRGRAARRAAAAAERAEPAARPAPKGVAGSTRPPASVPLPAPAAREKPPAPAAAPAAVPARSLLGPVPDLRRLRVACIFDEFTFHSFAPECELLPLRADTWQAQVEAFKPDLVFIESAWRGADDTWQRKVSDLGPELLALLDWALQARVPTAFWCKEDPVHFVRFLPVARLVDHVFTTDIDCIPRYMAALGHRRVHLLPFAAQPALHHPVETFEREDAFCFAGSYYRKYPERQADFHELVTVARQLRSVVIYDRNSRRPLPHDFSYPDEYRAELREALDYAEVDRAYKGYRYGLTVNTIKHSQTMFARRAFELMACNTVVVSNFSRGLRMFFGDLVVSSDDRRELERRLAPVCGDDRHYRALRLHGLRNVLSQHTYAHRLAYVASCLSGAAVAVPRSRIAVVAEVADEPQVRRIVSAFGRQAWQGAELFVLGPAEAVAAAGAGRHIAGRGELAAALAGFDHVAVLDPRDHHGPDYLGDLALATVFARGAGLTKASHHAWMDGQVRLLDDGRQYKPCGRAVLRRSLLRREQFVLAMQAAAGPLGDAACDAADLVAVDEFGYCADAAAAGSAFDPGAVEALVPGRPPIPLAEVVLRSAAAAEPPDARAASAVHLALSANELARLLPKQPDERVAISRDAKQRVVLESKLGEAEHTYLYLSRRFAPDELMSGSEMRFELEAEGELNACTVFVFRNGAEQKISQLTDRVGAAHALRLPAGTDHVRLALRVQGPGRVALGRLRIVPAPQDGIVPIAAADHLVVTRNYPAYDDLYRYAFVHSRVRAYARHGQPAHVLRLIAEGEPRFREFEDVDVMEADEKCLERFLAARSYPHLAVHAVDPRIWDVLRRHLGTARMVLWAHGAELQPWWRRAFSDGEGSAWARQTNDTRLGMWRDILRTRHPNLSVVFVSRRQLEDALGDLGLRPGDLGHVEVVHNFIDGERFAYLPKPPEQRLRVLSIRPYSSRVYANDLAVQAILRLQGTPNFDAMHFHLVGDGKLFDATVAPLRGLANVELAQGFVSQQRIAELHRENGVFLVPSRMDSQGVSRDEAMSSGLVPVTTRVAAVPEFVDTACGFLAEPEDAQGLADAMAALAGDPALFARLSAAAAQRVRSQSGAAQTIARELALLAAPAPAAASPVVAELVQHERSVQTIAVYGDVNLNILDGSAVWAASVVETLAGAPGVRVVLQLKTRVQRTLVLARLLDLGPQVRIVEPPLRGAESLTPAQAVAEIVALDVLTPLRGIVLRGLQVCAEAARLASLHGRIWAYLTDIPQRAEDLDATTRDTIAGIVAHSEFVLCQTPQMEAFLLGLFPAARGRTRILPPMIPPTGRAASVPAPRPFRLAYAGKFAPRWGIEAMFDAFAALHAVQPEAELHVFGDKIHQSSAEHPAFRETVQQRLESDPGVRWHGAVDRLDLLREIGGMHACWAFRDPAFERDCLELSTKVLEYAALQVPVVLARSAVNESVFGSDYPLFADSAAQAAALLQRLAEDAALRENVARCLARVADRYTFPAVRAALQRDGVLPPAA